MTAADVREPLCRVDQIADGGAHEVDAWVDGERESLVVLRSGATIRAFLNVCPHAGRPLNWSPGRFLIEQGLVICAAHGAAFTVPEGHCISGPCRGNRLREVAVDVVDGGVYLKPGP